MTEQELREKISNLVAEFHKTRTAEKTFVPGKTPIRYAGRVFDEKEIQAAVEASLDFWLTEGRFAEVRLFSKSACPHSPYIPIAGRKTIEARR